MAIGILVSKPVHADDGNANLVSKYIQSIVNKKPAPKWDEKIAPQLAARDEQIKQEEERKAREAAEAARVAADQAAQINTTKAPPPAAPAVTGSCADWMAAAGITDPATAYVLIMKESGCNPNSVNRSSGACGIGQQLPCGKWPHQWNDPVGAMIDMQGYVMGRYGSWQNALAWHLAHNWY